MSLPIMGSEGLPPIGLRTRQWIYLVLFVLVILANCIDVFFDVADPDSRYVDWRPWWLSGALRVLALLSGVGNLIALANARPTPGEQRVAAAKAELKAGNGGRALPAGAPLHAEHRTFPAEDRLPGVPAEEEDGDDTREQPRYSGD